jgi:hypothetical protein
MDGVYGALAPARRFWFYRVQLIGLWNNPGIFCFYNFEPAFR